MGIIAYAVYKRPTIFHIVSFVDETHILGMEIENEMENGSNLVTRLPKLIVISL